ncbi:MAG: FAD-dependent oxidoreductase [Anaerolineales bacterium]|nr:FAD-dependent oxidoreductase [Anaerolineales bacterium]
MTERRQGNHLVAVVGAGPAGLFAARKLASPDVHVIIFNRDIKPGGLAEYGIFPSKHKMKAGLRQQFNRILEIPEIEYYGNVVIGLNGDFTLNELRAFGFQAILVTVGAQGTKWLGLQGEDLLGVYHAKDIVYHYNKLPPFSERKFTIGKHVAVVGVGNVMLDIAHWLIREKKVDEVIAVARRGPAEVKFSKKELEYIAANMDLEDLDKEFERVAPIMQSVGQDVDEAKEFIISAIPKAAEPVSSTNFRFEFLASPSRILGGERGEVRGLEVENTVLIQDDGDIKAKRLGAKRVIPVDTVIFCIGDRVDETFGLPVRWNEFVKNPDPDFPVNGLSYEAYNPDSARPIDRVFVSGWAREASSGLVGVARKDGEFGAQAVAQYLQTQPKLKDIDDMLFNLRQRVEHLDKTVITKEDYRYLQQVESEEADRLGLEEFKFATQEEMLAAIKKVVAD